MNEGRTGEKKRKKKKRIKDQWFISSSVLGLLGASNLDPSKVLGSREKRKKKKRRDTTSTPQVLRTWTRRVLKQGTGSYLLLATSCLPANLISCGDLARILIGLACCYHAVFPRKKCDRISVLLHVFLRRSPSYEWIYVLTMGCCPLILHEISLLCRHSPDSRRNLLRYVRYIHTKDMVPCLGIDKGAVATYKGKPIRDWITSSTSR